MSNNKVIRRGDIWLADLGTPYFSEQGGVRPVLVLQNNLGNRFSPTVIVAAITGQKTKVDLPTHIELKAGQCGIQRDSLILLEQIRTADKNRFLNKVTELDPFTMRKVDYALDVSLGRVDIPMKQSKPVHNNKPILV